MQRQRTLRLLFFLLLYYLYYLKRKALFPKYRPTPRSWYIPFLFNLDQWPDERVVDVLRYAMIRVASIFDST
jgi:hypothetical protein